MSQTFIVEREGRSMKMLLGFMLIGWFINIIYCIITDDWNDRIF